MLIKIPLEKIDMQGDGYHLALQALVNQVEVRLILDTGASRTVFDVNRIDRFMLEAQLVPNEKLSTGLGTNEMQSDIISIESFELGLLHIKDYATVAIDLGHINQSYEMLQMPLIDGVLGGDLLEEFKAKIDYQRQELSLNFYKKDFPF